jgi:hypothetical protein
MQARATEMHRGITASSRTTPQRRQWHHLDECTDLGGEGLATPHQPRSLVPRTRLPTCGERPILSVSVVSVPSTTGHRHRQRGDNTSASHLHRHNQSHRYQIDLMGRPHSSLIPGPRSARTTLRRRICTLFTMPCWRSIDQCQMWHSEPVDGCSPVSLS